LRRSCMALDKLIQLARRTNPTQGRAYRLSSSVRLPWIVGLVLFLLLALAAALLVGRTGDEVRVPETILDYQESVTQTAAQSVRRSLNEGVDDLAAFSATLAPIDPDRAVSLAGPLEGAAEVHSRYLGLYVIDAQGEVLERVPEDLPIPDTLELVDPFQEAGMGNARRVEGSQVPIVLQYAPLPGGDGQARAVIGEYDPLFFRFPLAVADPGEVWLVTSDGRVIGSRGGFTAFQELPRRPLREAAARAAQGESGTTVVPGSAGRQEIVAFAPVGGTGPAGTLGWNVVTARSVDSLSLPETDARRQGLVLAIVLALTTAVVFGWLWIFLLRPLFRLQSEAERIAYGDLSKNVEVIRYDEIGLIARALERIRVLLVRQRIQGDKPARKKPPAEKES
jgi:HAMP domain-containing protein